MIKRFYGSVKNKAAVAGAVALGAVTSAHAAVDVSSVTSALEDAGTACATVGAASLVVYVGVKVYKLIRHAM